MDRKTGKMLLDAVERAKVHHKTLQERHEEKSWKPINLSSNLLNALSSLTKNDLDSIRKNYQLQGISSLRKQELAIELSKQVPEKFASKLYLLDDERYKLIKKIVNHSGFLYDYDLSFKQISILRDYSMIFPGKYDNKNVLFMPTELIQIFKDADGSELKRAIQENTEIIRIVHGMTYYYGVVDSTYLAKQVEKLTGTKIDRMNFFTTLSFAAKYHGQVKETYDGYVDFRIFTHSDIVKAHKERANIDYKSFTKDQLIAASQEFYFEKNKTMMDLLKFFKDHYEISNLELEEVGLQLESLIKEEAPPNKLIEYLQSVFEFPTFEFVQDLTGRLMDLYNHTRSWILKGHTPNEIHQLEKKHLQPLKETRFSTNAEDNKVIQLSNYKKTGRNEPCPCGSGKKYKKCCKN
ncbi:YecA family protein [Anaerobacillus arseniciselenatis]|nr:SEC-C metal-binding domain-containing protein [Anaerobacillus arseniciselenatis]